MEFDKTKVYTALNATEDLIGAKGYFADDIETLKYKVCNTESIQHYKETFCERLVSDIDDSYNFFYLVEPTQKWYVLQDKVSGIYHKPTKCPLTSDFCKCVCIGSLDECEQFISEHSKPKYRPFKDCDELIETYKEEWCSDLGEYDLPTIWVKDKADVKYLLTEIYINDVIVGSDNEKTRLSELFEHYTFLDGSVCGVEE